MSDYASGDPLTDPQVQRDWAAAQGRPYALVMQCGLEWDIGAPLPAILQWEHEAHLFFHLPGDEGVGSVAFGDCRCTTFGPPGEEGHALEGSGWEAYRPLRVMNSPWLARMIGAPTDLSHFVLPFHDTTFECIAHSFKPSRVPGSMADAVQAAIDRWD